MDSPHCQRKFAKEGGELNILVADLPSTHTTPQDVRRQLTFFVTIRKSKEQLCGMEFFTNEVICNLLSSSLQIATLEASGFKEVGAGPGSRAGEYIERLTIADQKQAVFDDVLRIRTHPLDPSSIQVYRYIYDVRSRKLLEVQDVTVAGASH